MTDIIDRLVSTIEQMEAHPRDVFDTVDLLKDAKLVIEQLRSIAGAASLESGLTFGAIKGEIRDGK